MQEFLKLNAQLMHRALYTCMLMLFGVLCSEIVFAQAMEYHEFGNVQGLSNSSVNCIFEDSHKMLWIGTWDGLNSYDGAKFTIFRPEVDQNGSLSNQVVLQVNEDAEGDLWILTMHGINRYHRSSNKFERFFFSKEDIPPVNEFEFLLALNSQKQVFCSVKDWGIGYFDGTSFQRLILNDETIGSVKKLCCVDSSRLLVLSEAGVLKAYTLTHNKQGVLCGAQLFQKKNIKDVVVTSGAIVVLDGSGDAASYSFVGSDLNQERVHHVERMLGVVKAGLLLHTVDGLAILNNSGRMSSAPWLTELKQRNIITVTQGSSSTIWLGTDGEGLIQVFPSQSKFPKWDESRIPEMKNGIVRSFCVTDSILWVGTKGKGLFRISNKAYEVFNASNSMINNSVFTLCKGQDSLLYLGTDGEGLQIFDLKYNKILNWKDVVGFEKAQFQSVYALFQDKEGMLWLGTNGYGMLCCKIERVGKKLRLSYYKQYKASDSQKGLLSNNIVFSIIAQNDSCLWVGTRLGGLNLFNKRTEQFTTFKHVPNNSHSLSSNDVLSLYQDEKKQLYVGTSLGLNVLRNAYSTDTSFDRFTMDNGLPNNTIHGIIPDREGNVWLSTNLGLSQWIKKENRFVNYRVSDGLQNNEFADGASYYDKQSNLLYVGGIGGFNYFKSENVKRSKEIPNLMIHKISGQSSQNPYLQSLLITPRLHHPEHLTLAYNQNFFDIELGALCMINNEKCQYAYKLEEFDKDWNLIHNRRTFSFTNIPPGKYKLYLKWSNPDGVWSDAVEAFDLEILPAFWKSWWAYTLYCVLFVLFVFFVKNYFQKQSSLRRAEFLRLQEERLHENKLSFFTNIAHELQTPLTLLVGPAEKLMTSAYLNTADSKLLAMIHRNTSRLSFLIQQLLEFRKAESSHLNVKYTRFNLSVVLNLICELFHEAFKQHDIVFNVQTPEDCTGCFDQDKIEKIAFNLISNAYKYTPVGGRVTVLLRKEKEDVVIEVCNTGDFITKEKRTTIFDNYFILTNKSDQQGDRFRTGIGLAYVKTLVESLRGRIEVQSENGTNHFIVYMPQGDLSECKYEDQKQESLSPYLEQILDDVTLSDDKLSTKQDRMQRVEQVVEERATLLIVEDELDIHRLLKAILGDKYLLLFAQNGLEALEILEAQLPDLIISDVMMPGMDGIELCRRVKENMLTCFIPVILLTAKIAVQHRLEGLEVGANSYIPKPFHPEHLEVRIRKLLEERARIKTYFSKATRLSGVDDLPMENEDKEFVQKLFSVILGNLDNNAFSIADLEESVSMSSSSFYRKLKEVSSLAPADFIRSVKLKHAAKLLSTTKLTVSEVCYQSGFNNRSYFYREFQKMYNTSPTVYRNTL